MKLVIFDLDGTLIDSAGDIASSVNELLERAGRDLLPLERVRSFVGNGARRLVERAMPGLDPDGLDEALSSYLEIYRRRMLETTRPYPGVREALELLTPGRSLAVLTNKPRRESVLILEDLELIDYFFAVYGGDSFPRRKPDPVGVAHLRNEAGASRAQTLFVGDTSVDRETAERAAVAFCRVSYGLALEEAAAQDLPAGPEPMFRVDDLRELASLV